MASLTLSDPSSPNSSSSSSSRPAPTSSVYSMTSTSPRYDPSPLNSLVSSSSMNNYTSSFMSGSSTSMDASSSWPQPSPRALVREDRNRKVVGISVPKSSMANTNLFQDKFQSGDIVQRVAGAEDDCFSSPFPSGKRGLLDELRNFHKSGVSVLTIQVNRGERQITRRALIVPHKKKQKYVLQDYEDPTHIFSFDDYTWESCLSMQDQGLKRAQEQVSKMRVAAVDVAYAWGQKTPSVDGLKMVYSMLVVPHAYADIRKPKSSPLEDTIFQAITWLPVVPHAAYADTRKPKSSTLEDTILKAVTWLHLSEASGVPLIFRSIQTEPLITEDSEQSLNADLSSIVSSGAYSLQQHQGLSDRRIVIRAVRIWFAFRFTEVKVELEVRQGEALLGLTIGRTLEGFCYVTEVVPHTAAHRMGLKERLDLAKAQGMKLVVTKVGDESVLPWFISNGNIRCYDINSISRKLSAHHHAGKPACLHILDIREQRVHQCLKCQDPC